MATPVRENQLDAEPQLVISNDLGFIDLQRTFVLRSRLLWNERRLLARALVLGLVLGLVTALLIPNQYESSVQLMPPDNQSGQGLAMVAALAGGASGLGSVAGDLLGMKSTGDQFVGMLHSRTAQDDLVRQFDLKKVYRTNLEEDARKTLNNKTRVSIDRKSGIITITVEDYDPYRAASLAQAYVDELDHLVATLSTSAAHRERVFLDGRLKAVKEDLDQAAKDLSQFSSKNTTLDITEQAKTMVQAAAALQGELIAAESELKGLEQIYSPNNVRVRSVQARISELQQQLQKLGGTAGSVPAENAENQLYPSIRELPILGVTYMDLYRRTKIEEAVYENLTKQYEIAKVEEVKETPSVKVLDSANVPEGKSFPPRTLIVMLSATLITALATFGVFARNRWSQMEPDDPGKALAQEVLHSVNSRMPWAPPNGSRFQAVTHQVWQRVARRSEKSLQNEN
jgi:capsule polysaccharide export protein KpsE/RkpR